MPNTQLKAPPTLVQDNTLDVSKFELQDRGPQGKFLFVPSALRDHLFTYCDIKDLFDPKCIGHNDENVPDHIRRHIKNNYSVSVPAIVARIEEVKEQLEDYGYGHLSMQQIEQLKEMITLIEQEAVLLQEKFSKGGANSDVTCDELCVFLNSKGTLFAYRTGTQLFGFIAQTAAIKTSWTGPYIEVNGLIHASFGEGISSVPYQFSLPYFRGLKPLDDVGIYMLDHKPEIKEELIARGEKYVELVTKPTYSQYAGSIVRRSWWTDRAYKADGRIMVDIGAMRNIDPDYNMYFGWDRYHNRGKEMIKLTSFSPEQYASMAPYVYGFSFSSKVWGEILVDSVTDIVFRDDAYDMLVMDEGTKDMVFALVDNSITGTKDFIDGKGGGCIFLLAGPPGGGKTLTAEAIAERLNRPLYMVGVGELGTDVESLEENLRKILDVATTWNAVLLIDECDIFMEKRSEMDVHRNAMVGVFLRLLEYYEGVLFLTTNRAANIDPAFYSRISLALHYDPLNVADRKIVWGNLLKIYSVENIDVEALAHYELNGRKIKNVIRIAKALASADKRAPEVSDFIRVIDTEAAFKKATEAHS